ncbi:MAG: glycosyltransferase [Deltaproteobacteria bacterium]|nr:glycosyltransferase [Deltaproteobacteria bacterium]
MGWAAVVLATYLSILGLLSINGLHRAWLVWAWVRRPGRQVPPTPAELPVVTVQLPLFDERYVVRRLVEACAALDWPRDRLEIQVLDDSRDETTAIAAALVARYRSEGLDIHLVHRDDRQGFKAGALAAGLLSARGDVIAIFDADFVPPPDFLRRTVPWLEAGVGMVQTRWGHLNRRESWITEAQATLLDGHFVIEHTARHRTGRWFNFNGTAGIWRRQAIDDAGGWSHDTLTEDLDLSYRAQLRGWRFVYLDDIVTPAELPSDVRAFKTQQHRWAKGSVQTCRKLLGRIWESDASLAIKLEATAHLTANFSYPLVLLLSLFLPWALAARIAQGPALLLALDSVLLGAAIVPFVAFYGSAIAGSGSRDVGRRLLLLPIVLAVGLGMAVAQTKAVLDGLDGPVGSFVRTPKTGGSGSSGYGTGPTRIAWIELAFGAYIGAAGLFALSQGYLASLPFLALFGGGFTAVGLSTLLGPGQAAIPSASSAGIQVTDHSQAGSVQAPLSSTVDKTP